jgi:hypothetical protein
VKIESASSPTSDHHMSGRRWLALLLPVALAALALYGPVVRLPNIYDTLLHIRITIGLDWRTVWLPTWAFGFYRPFTFAPLLAIKSLFGYYPAWVLNGINVVQHALNATLLAALAWRAWRNRWRAAAAGLLFAFFPFSYQAIAVYGHNVHPAIVGVFLIGLHTYLAATQAGKHALVWWALTGLVFLVGLLTHESAVLFGAFAFLISLPISFSKIIARRRPPAWLVFLILGGAYVVVYRFLPIGGSPQADFGDSGSLWTRLLYFAQGAAYPLTWFARWLRQWPTVALILSGFGLTLALAAWAARKRENRWPLMLGWGWWLTASALLAFSLQTAYLLHGPRLLYLSSVGLALAWAVMLDELTLPRVGRNLVPAATAFVLITGGLFVRARLADYARLTSPVNVIAAEMRDRPPDTGLLLVNVPDWLSPAANQYPFGAELTAMLGEYLFVEELVDQNVGGQHTTQSIAISDALAATDYAYGVHNQTAYSQLWWGTDEREWHVFVTEYTSDGPTTIHTGWLTAPTTPSAPIATFGPYQLLSAEAVACDSVTIVTLIWQTTQPASDITPSLAVFVHVVDAGEQLLGQDDGPPLGLRPQLVPSTAGRLIADRRVIETSGGQPTHIRIGVYDFGDGQRFAATDASGARLADEIFYWPVSECP